MEKEIKVSSFSRAKSAIQSEKTLKKMKKSKKWTKFLKFISKNENSF